MAGESGFGVKHLPKAFVNLDCSLLSENGLRVHDGVSAEMCFAEFTPTPHPEALVAVVVCESRICCDLCSIILALALALALACGSV